MNNVDAIFTINGIINMQIVVLGLYRIDIFGNNGIVPSKMRSVFTGILLHHSVIYREL